ncbi:REP-associated tyrosine transposase [Candidatus Entotheonella palauensis]|uniref:REP-associated tyrosine transposase n=1 Tax=Candidatus Entotheonella palauensis TaxID=93172 RepID=UPI000B7F6F17|nr:transposase [Candidatus Entotheonella palauensis]
MSRPLRLEFPGAVYHLTARGNAQQDIFLNATDRDAFLAILGREIDQHRWHCYAYCLMDNHYHLLIETPEANLVQGMQRLNSRYAQRFNRRHQRVGHLFQGRYKSILVDRENHLLELTRYIVLNPVRAGMVTKVESWPWSSFRATSNEVPRPPWLNVAWLLSQFGRNESFAIKAYRQFVQEGAQTPSPWAKLQGQIWLGDDAFREHMQSCIEGKSLQDIPMCQTCPHRPLADDILAAVSAAYDRPLDLVSERSHPQAFRAWVYLLRRAANLRLKEVARLAGISAPRVSQIQREIEQGEVDSGLRQLLEHYKLKL